MQLVGIFFKNIFFSQIEGEWYEMVIFGAVVGFGGLWWFGVAAGFDEGDEKFLAGDRVTIDFVGKWKNLS